MRADDFMSYLIATDQLDEFMGFKENIVKCPNCNEEMFIYKTNLLYCKKCKYILEHNKDEKVANKKLTYTEKTSISC